MDNLKHEECAMAGRVEMLEDAINNINTELCGIKDELKAKAISYENVERNMGLMMELLRGLQQQMLQFQSVPSEVANIRDNMMKLVAETLEKTRSDMSSLVQLSAMSEDKEKQWQRQSEERDKRFYRKLIIIMVSTMVTIVLAYFGIKSIIPMV